MIKKFDKVWIEKIKLPEEPQLEPGQTATRIPKLIETMKKLNEVINIVNQIIDELHFEKETRR